MPLKHQRNSGCSLFLRLHSVLCTNRTCHGEGQIADIYINSSGFTIKDPVVFKFLACPVRSFGVFSWRWSKQFAHIGTCSYHWTQNFMWKSSRSAGPDLIYSVQPRAVLWLFWRMLRFFQENPTSVPTSWYQTLIKAALSGIFASLVLVCKSWSQSVIPVYQTFLWIWNRNS